MVLWCGWNKISYFMDALQIYAYGEMTKLYSISVLHLRECVQQCSDSMAFKSPCDIFGPCGLSAHYPGRAARIVMVSSTTIVPSQFVPHLTAPPQH
jgi:hypothetical protein